MKAPKAHRVLLVAVAVLAAPASAFAYPIPPVTLWELVKKSDTIVLAEVSKVERRSHTARDHDWNDSVAILTVRETWKGGAFSPLRVPFPAGMICPAPPRYEEWLTVLAFLTRDEKGAYTTVGLSYGTLYPDLDEIAIYRELISQAVAAQGPGTNDAQRESVRIDWLVRAAVHPATRWQGLYELAPGGDALHFFYDHDRNPERVGLTAVQLGTLANAFVASPVLDTTLTMMLRALDGHPSPEVDRTAVAAVDTVLDLDKPPYWTPDLVTLTLKRLGRLPPPAPKSKKQDSLLADPLLGGLEFDAAGLRARWTTVRKDLPFPDRRLDLPRRQHVRSSGPATPP